MICVATHVMNERNTTRAIPGQWLYHIISQANTLAIHYILGMIRMQDPDYDH